MHNEVNEYVLKDEDLPVKYQQVDVKNSRGAHAEPMYDEICKMVNKLPDVFSGKRWDKYRDKKCAGNDNSILVLCEKPEIKNDANNESTARDDDIPF